MRLEVLVDEAGEVQEVTAVESKEGQSLLEAAAVEALRQWTFAPAQNDGEAVPGRVLVPIRFELRGEAPETGEGNDEKSASRTGNDRTR